MFDYVKPIKRDLDPEAYAIHMGTNELKGDKNKIIVSTFVPRGDDYNTKVENVNTLLKEFCENNGIDMISHDNINVKKHLNK